LDTTAKPAQIERFYRFSSRTLFLGSLLSFAALLSCGGRSQADFSLPVGQVTATDNPQVGLYTMTLPSPGSVTVNFGTGTNYGLN
jgi:hypothetical protein